MARPDKALHDPNRNFEKTSDLLKSQRNVHVYGFFLSTCTVSPMIRIILS